MQERSLVCATITGLLLASSSALAIFADPAKAANAAPKVLVIVPPTSVQSKSTQIQRFDVNLPVTAEQAAMPLTLKLSNGIGGYNPQKFVWIRAFLNSGMSPRSGPSQNVSGRMVVDANAFKASSTVVLDLTGKLVAGNNLLMIQGAGMPGATLRYELDSTEVKGVVITSVDPTEVPPGGSLTLNGTGFDESAAKNVAMIYNRSVKVKSASAKALEVVVPTGLAPHAYDVNVTVNGVKSNSQSFTVTGPPELGSSSMSALVPPSFGGTPIEITGHNFSKDPSKDVVTISIREYNIKKTAQVLKATSESLQIQCPEFPDMSDKINSGVNTPADLTLEVNGIPATGSLTVYISIRPMVR